MRTVAIRDAQRDHLLSAAFLSRGECFDQAMKEVKIRKNE